MGEELPPKMREKIYHDVLLPDEAEEIRKEVRSFAEKEIEPRGWELDNAEEKIENFPEEIFNKMANEGLFAIPFSEEFGGRGLEHPVCSMVVTMEELGYASGSIAGIYDVQAMLTGHLLSQYASKNQKEEYLKPLIKGEKIGCFATTEPGASNDLRPETLETTAEKDGDTWIVNGQKRYISDAPVGDFVATLCVTDGSLNEILIDLDSDGVEVGEPDKKMGNRAQLVADIKFDNVEVPESNLIGEKGEGLRIALGTLTYGRIGVGASGVGGAQAGFDETVNYLKKGQLSVES